MRSAMSWAGPRSRRRRSRPRPRPWPGRARRRAARRASRSYTGAGRARGRRPSPAQPCRPRRRGLPAQDPALDVADAQPAEPAPRGRDEGEAHRRPARRRKAPWQRSATGQVAVGRPSTTSRAVRAAAPPRRRGPGRRARRPARPRPGHGAQRGRRLSPRPAGSSSPAPARPVPCSSGTSAALPRGARARRGSATSSWSRSFPCRRSDAIVELVHQPARARAGRGRGRRRREAVAQRGLDVADARPVVARDRRSGRGALLLDAACSTISPRPAWTTMLRAISEIAVAISVASVARSRAARPCARPRRGAGTRSASPPMGDADLIGHPRPSPCVEPVEQGQRLVEVERGVERLQVEAELHHRDRDVRAGCRRSTVRAPRSRAVTRDRRAATRATNESITSSAATSTTTRGRGVARPARRARRAARATSLSVRSDWIEAMR